jgi:hypothetical protein
VGEIAGGAEIKKSYSVFIEMDADELADFVHPIFKKKGSIL